jgi:hypothetical protein
MATFKVKYATRNKLARALQREIKSLDLIDTGALYDSVRISAMSGTRLNEINIVVNVLYYYYFLDEGTQYIGAFDITEKWLGSSEVQSIIGEVMQQYIEWQFQTYPLLEMASILNNPELTLTFNWIDDPYGLPAGDVSSLGV